MKNYVILLLIFFIGFLLGFKVAQIIYLNEIRELYFQLYETSKNEYGI